MGTVRGIDDNRAVAVRRYQHGERFLVPPEAQYAYVVGTIDVARQRLTVTLAGDLIAEWPYPLR